MLTHTTTTTTEVSFGPGARCQHYPDGVNRCAEEAAGFVRGPSTAIYGTVSATCRPCGERAAASSGDTEYIEGETDGDVKRASLVTTLRHGEQ